MAGSNGFRTLFMQAKVLDASWRELCLIMFSLLDEETRAQVLEHPDVRALQCEVDNLGTGLGAYGGCGFFRLREPAFPLKSAGI